MKLLSSESCRRRWSQLGVDADALLRGTFRGDGWGIATLDTPESFRRCASFVVSLSSAMEDFATESLCWMTQWGISSPELDEIGVLFWKRLRFEAEGIDRLAAFPGHLFESGEDSALNALLVLAMVNVWDCLWLNAEGNVVLFISHDGFLRIYHRGEISDRITAHVTAWSQP